MIYAGILIIGELIMRECWINVYEYKWLDGKITIKQGYCFPERRTIYGKSSTIRLLYRIHVRMKNEA